MLFFCDFIPSSFHFFIKLCQLPRRKGAWTLEKEKRRFAEYHSVVREGQKGTWKAKKKVYLCLKYTRYLCRDTSDEAPFPHPTHSFKTKTQDKKKALVSLERISKVYVCVEQIRVQDEVSVESCQYLWTSWTYLLFLRNSHHSFFGPYTFTLIRQLSLLKASR